MKTRKRAIFKLSFFIIILLFVFTAVGIFLMIDRSFEPQSSGKATIQEDLTSGIDLVQRDRSREIHDALPSNAEKLDWTLIEGIDIWAQEFMTERGPFYGLYEGVPISITYFSTEEHMLNVPWFKRDPNDSGDLLRQMMYESVAPLDMSVDHFDVVFTTNTRTGLPDPHWEITAWRVSHSDHVSISQGQNPSIEIGSYPTSPSALPEDATMSTEPLLGLGQHWWTPENHPNGPFWVTICNLEAKHEVVGVVYMYSEADMDRSADGTLEFLDIPLKYTPTHMHFILSPSGWHGFETNHWDLRVQFIRHETHMSDWRFHPASFERCNSATTKD